MGFLGSVVSGFGNLIGGAASLIPGIGPVAGGLIGAASNAISGIGDNIQQNANIDAYNRGQLELAKYTADRNVEFWNMQNEYNTPLKQMERYVDAGLNPNLIYGQINPGNASSAPSMEVPKQEARQWRSFQTANAYLDLKAKQEQINLLKAQARNQNASAENNISHISVNDATSSLLALRAEVLQPLADFSSSVEGRSAPWLEWERNVRLNETQKVQYESAMLQQTIAKYLYENGYYTAKLGAQRSDAVIKSIYAQMWSKGINPNDNIFVRTIFFALKEIAPKIPSIVESSDGFWDSVFNIGKAIGTYITN